jgi:hypothetical protein
MVPDLMLLDADAISMLPNLMVPSPMSSVSNISLLLDQLIPQLFPALPPHKELENGQKQTQINKKTDKK